MNLPEPISYFMTSSCWSCLSISEQVINIKMKFFCMSYQKPPISIVFTNVFSCKEWMPLHQSFIKSNLVLISVLSEKVFSLSFVFFSSWQKVHEYHFTHDCGCISINQEIKKYMWRIYHGPGELQTVEIFVPDTNKVGKQVCTSTWMCKYSFLQGILVFPNISKQRNVLQWGAVQGKATTCHMPVTGKPRHL